MQGLEFEKPVLELESQLQALYRQREAEPPAAAAAAEAEAETTTEAGAAPADSAPEIARLEARRAKLLGQIYGRLTPAQKVQVARHPDRPHGRACLQGILTEFEELAGDRRYGEDPALVCGLGRLHGRAVAAIAQEKGADTDSRLHCNFGMARPEGYRKAVRVMRLAERFGLPVITLIDSPGAYPGIGAEERGQAEAIAASLECSLSLGVPILSAVIGEGGSGGAVALATGDRVAMLEHAIYSVISPEGCAAILWRDQARSRDAAAALGLTAQDVAGRGLIDTILPEPLGGAHRDPPATLARIAEWLARSLAEMEDQDPGRLAAARRARYLALTREDLGG